MQQTLRPHSADSPPYLEVGGEGPLLHFSHANGYPPMAYRAFLQPFTKTNQVIASLHRPLWTPTPSPESLLSWQVFGEDLIKLADEREQPLISIGHSMGSVAILIAAAKRPDLFQSIVLIEPVLVPRRFLLALRFFGRFAKNRIPLVKRTLLRVDSWSNKQEAFEHFRPKHVFKDISDEVMWDYINHGVEDVDDGSVRLTYSKEWEARCYTLVHNLWQLLPQISVPVLAIRGQQSNTIFPAAWNKWRSISPQHDFMDVDNAGHLVPFEKPDYLASEIQDWLNRDAAMGE